MSAARQMSMFSPSAEYATPKQAAADVADDLAQAQIAVAEAAGMNRQDGTDLCSEIERVLGEMNRRGEEDLENLRRLHARIVGCSVDELDAKIAAEEAERKAKLETARANRPPPAPRASKRGKSKPAADEPASAPTARLTDRQRELLAQFDVSQNVARFRSEERIDDWPAVKAVFVALGAKWRTGKPGGFYFPDTDDGAEKVRLALSTGEIFDPKAAGFFPTPAALAKRLVEMAEIKPGELVLEPSAGRGAIAVAIREAGGIAACIEFLPDNAAELRRLGFEVKEKDFLGVRARDVYDAAVMNPPFGDRQDIAHIRRAFGWLRPGGRLVSVASSGIQFRDDALATEFRAWVAEHGGSIESLPDGSFLESGTGVRTCVVTVRRSA